MKSLDPRVTRLPDMNKALQPKPSLDQWGTFEVFVKPKEGKPFQHEGAVHAVDPDLAFVLAKETFTRRFLCSSLFVTATQNVFVTDYTDNNQNIYETVNGKASGEGQTFEIFHLLKRGKQHVHGGSVVATDHEDALRAAKQKLSSGVAVLNVWVIRTDDIRFTSSEEQDLWNTLPDKKFRDASDYKAGDKLTEFTERN